MVWTIARYISTADSLDSIRRLFALLLNDAVLITKVI